MNQKKIRAAGILLLLTLLIFSSDSSAQYSLVGNAAQTGPTNYKLTNDVQWENGSLWYINQMNLNNSFDLIFELYFGNHDDGADGMTFTLQQQSLNAGGPGGGLGASGITPSVIVEYDTYQNVDYLDPAFDHIAIEKNGVADHSAAAYYLAGPVQANAGSADIEDGQWHSTRVKWNATTQTMDVYFDCVLRLSYTGDIINTVFGGNPLVYYGFTASTGGATNEQSVRGFHFGHPEVIDTALCVGDSVQIDISGDQTYNWVPNSNISSNTSPNPYLFPTISTQYVATVSNCYLSWNDTINVIVHNLPTPTVADQAICTGAAAATFDAGPYAAYQWSVNGTGTNRTTSGTNPGNYTVLVTDANGCQASATGVLTVNTLPVVTFSLADDQMCINEAAQAINDGNPVGGTFSGSGVSGSNFDPSSLAAGSHTITYTYNDGNNCTNTASDNMNVNALPVVTFNLIDDQTCIGGATQAIADVNPAGGIFSGAGVSGSNFYPSLTTAGSHILTYSYTDGNGCSNTATDVMTVNDLPLVTFALTDDQMCINDAAQAINAVNPAGGSFSGTGVSGSNYNPSLANVGTHTITYSYTDSKGCSNTAADDMTVNDLPVVTFTLADDEMCSNEATQALTVANPLGGTFSGAGVSGSNYNPGITTAGSHIVTYSYTDAKGCANSASDNMTVNVVPNVSIADKTICAGTTTTFTAGAGFANYSWSGQGIGNGQSTNASTPGVYIITVTDAEGCSASDNATLTINPLPVPDLGIDIAICQGQTTTLNPKTSNSLTYSWTPGNASSSTLQASATGKYKVTVSDWIGCKGSDSVFVQVHSLPAVSLGNNLTICDNDFDKLTLHATYSGNKQVSWSTLENNVDSVVITHAGSYWVQITDSNQCKATDSIEVAPYCSEFELEWPNVVTPNGDGHNDAFFAKNIDDSNYQKMSANIKVISFSVYDRWGILMYYTEENVLPRWDGRYNGEAVSPGTYYFIIKYSTSAGKNYEVPGFMTLL
ncbi:MAG: lectin-like domain-containing protein [Flavobacteriales bacterium]